MALEFDIDSISTRIINTLKLSEAWKDILFYSTNNYLINAFSKEIANLASQDQFLTRETRWDLAKNKTSLATQAKFRGYSLLRKTGATGTLRVAKSQDLLTASEWDIGITYAVDDKVRYDDKLYQALTISTGQQPDTNPTDWVYINNMHSSVITIPKYTVFSTTNGLQFCTTQAYSMSTTEEYKDVSVVQGIPKTYTQTANGDDFERILIENTKIEQGNYEVYVNSVLFTEVDDIYNSVSGDYEYEVITESDFSAITIKFGDDNFGYKLSNTDFVTIKYVETEGLDGIVSSVDAVNLVNSTIYDNTANSVTMYCTNYEVLDGGKEEDTKEQIRAKGIRTFQAGQRAVSTTDYEVILLEENYIKKASVWGAYEYAIDNGYSILDWLPVAENLVYVSAITPTETPLTTAQKTEIVVNILDKKPPTDILQFVDVEFIYLSFNIDARVTNENYVLSDIQNEITTLLETDYSVDVLDFMESIYDTQWKGKISAIEGISHHTSFIKLVEAQGFDFGYGLYDANITLAVGDITPSSLEVWVRDTVLDTAWVKVAIDDGSGNWTPEAGYTLSVSSYINYTTGAGRVYISTGLSQPYDDYDVRIYYKPVSLDLSLSNRNQIFKYLEINDIDVTYV